MKKSYGDFVTAELPFEAFANYEVCVEWENPSLVDMLRERLKEVLLRAEDDNGRKVQLYWDVLKMQTEEEILSAVRQSDIAECEKQRFFETL